jgi:hypothetical protein
VSSSGEHQCDHRRWGAAAQAKGQGTPSIGWVIR